jgi:PGF-CTERM protein
MNVKALAVALLLVVSAIGPATAAATGVTQDASATTGTYVEFQTDGDALTDYSVNGKTVVDSVAVQSKSEAQSSGGLGASVSLKAVTNFQAAGLSIASGFDSQASTSATVESQSGATIEAHDNDRGVMVVTAAEESQYVMANLSSDAEAEQSSDKRVVVTKESGESGAFLVVGEGKVTVNEEGNVSADLAQDAKLVYRQYEGERSDGEKQQEQLIADGTATAEVYYQQAEESGEDGQQRTADVVRYSEDTTVEVTERSQNEVNMTVERAQSQGKVVIVSVSEAAMENAQNAKVFVDGEAAVKASSYSEVQSAANGGDDCKYLVQSSSSAQASTDVVVGINHFSAREMSVQSGDDSSSGGDGGDGSGDSPTEGSGPGFGVLATLAAIGAALFARTRL